MTKWLLALVLSVTAFAYSPIRSNGWVYEDMAMMTVADGQPNYSVGMLSRNLARGSIYLTGLAFGNSPLPQHIVQVVGHLVNGLLVYALAVTVLSSLWAVLTMAIFLLHPIQVETAAYVASRPDLLMTMAVLGAVNLAVRPTVWWRSLGVGACLCLALSAKQTGIVAAPILLLIYWWKQPERREPFAWAFAGMIAACLTLIAQVPHDPDALPYGFIGTPAYQSAAWMNLVRLVLLPVGFTIDHNIGIVTPFAAFLALGAICGLAGFALVGMWRWSGSAHPFWPVLALWPALVLAPRFVLRGPEFTNEHQLYVAMPAICLGLTLLLKGMYEFSTQEGPSGVRVGSDQSEPSGSGLDAGNGLAIG